ncbi:hypothetical protein [Pseudonocardia acaciae]|uniref:hypothetical protein n=1 Tax=Pseudonocardia acaciae TaxID=551276 RepID=UPI00048A8A5B|nr:hypothetical protein [Pseudonocardia acaciae]
MHKKLKPRHYYEGLARDAQLVAEARYWVEDCWPYHRDIEELEEMPDAMVLKGVDAHYEGGLDQFMADR